MGKDIPPIKFTNFVNEDIKKGLKPLLNKKILPKFPEIQTKIKVGFTKSGGKYIHPYVDSEDCIYIRLSDTSINNFVLAHELTHSLQYHQADSEINIEGFNHEKIPHGERQADLFTLARHKELIDRYPSYLEIPSKMKEKPISRWKDQLHSDALKSIKKRENGYRNYLKWFENQLKLYNVCEG